MSDKVNKGEKDKAKQGGKQGAKQDDQPSGPTVQRNFVDKGRIYRKGEIYVIGSGGAKKAESLKDLKLIA